MGHFVERDRVSTENHILIPTRTALGVVKIGPNKFIMIRTRMNLNILIQYLEPRFKESPS